MIRTYTELIRIPTFVDRFRYLKLNGVVGDRGFGWERYLNQIFYQSKEWKSFRNKILIRDGGCDLGIAGMEIYEFATIHHLNPISAEDLKNENFDILLNPENAITTSELTHRAIHYSNESLLPQPLVERKPFDTCPWRQ